MEVTVEVEVKMKVGREADMDGVTYEFMRTCVKTPQTRRIFEEVFDVGGYYIGER